MHRLTGGRFTLGIGRGVKPVFQALSLPAITIEQMEDFAGLMRRLWRGEVIFDHDGPAGHYPERGALVAENTPLRRLRRYCNDLESPAALDMHSLRRSYAMYLNTGMDIPCYP